MWHAYILVDKREDLHPHVPLGYRTRSIISNGLCSSHMTLTKCTAVGVLEAISKVAGSWRCALHGESICPGCRQMQLVAEEVGLQ
jgi:hypothetical protein